MQRKKAQEVSMEEMLRIRAELHKARPRYQELITLLWYTGARINEIRQLRVADLDLGTNNPVVRFPAAATKTQRARAQPIPTSAARRLADSNQHWHKDRALFPTRPYRNGENRYATEPATTRTLSGWLRRAADAAGLPDVTAHTFRHSYATRILRHSNLRIAQLLLGHAAVSSTQLYTHPTPEDLRRAVVESFAEE